MFAPALKLHEISEAPQQFVDNPELYLKKTRPSTKKKKVEKSEFPIRKKKLKLYQTQGKNRIHQHKKDVLLVNLS